jgi:hypothetical protein
MSGVTTEALQQAHDADLAIQADEGHTDRSSEHGALGSGDFPPKCI